METNAALAASASRSGFPISSKRILTDGRLRLLSLTLQNRCCMMNQIVYLSDTEGSVPPSANERGVTNR